MIFIDRASFPVPDALRSKRTEAARKNLHSLFSSSSQEHLDQLRIKFEQSVWMATRPALEELFHGKCAYCETMINSSQKGDIEHFRPKQGAESLNGEREHLYYAWLAYDWDNLLIICNECNRRHKGQLFPVTGPRAPMLSSVEACRAVESGTLLDPCFDRPEEHLTFNKDSGLCVPITNRGKLTIEVLSLNRTSLTHERRAQWLRVDDLLRSYLVTLADKPSDTEPILQRIVESLSGRLPHTAFMRTMMKHFLSERFMSSNIEFLARDLERGGFAPEPESTPKITVQSPPELNLPSLPADTISPRQYHFPGYEPLPRLAYERIRRVEIRNFKGIESLDLDFPETTLAEGDSATSIMLLGENATGKSSILEAIILTLLGTKQIANLGLRGSDYIRRDEKWNPPTSSSPRAEVSVYFEDRQTAPVSIAIDPHTGIFEGNDAPVVVLLGYGPRRFFVEGTDKPFSSDPSARVETLFNPTAVVTNPSSWLMNCGDKIFSAAVRALRQILLLPDEAMVKRPQEGMREGAAIMFDMYGVASPLSRLSDGYKTVVAMSVDVMREMLRYWPDLERAQGIVLVDEIETHLHPRWKMRIVQRLRRAMPHVQFIATTHDPLCLRGLLDGEVKVLRRRDGGVEQLTQLPNVRGLSVEQLLMSDYFGLFSTEDPKTEEDVARYCSLATKRDRTPEDESDLERQREGVRQTLVVGATPERQLVQEAAAEFLAKRRGAPNRARSALRREAVEKVLDIWKSIKPAEDGG